MPNNCDVADNFFFFFKEIDGVEDEGQAGDVIGEVAAKNDSPALWCLHEQWLHGWCG